MSASSKSQGNPLQLLITQLTKESAEFEKKRAEYNKKKAALWKNIAKDLKAYEQKEQKIQQKEEAKEPKEPKEPKPKLKTENDDATPVAKKGVVKLVVMDNKKKKNQKEKSDKKQKQVKKLSSE